MADNTIRDQLAADIWRYDDYIDYAVSGCTQRDAERLAAHLLTKGYRAPAELDADPAEAYLAGNVDYMVGGVLEAVRGHLGLEAVAVHTASAAGVAAVLAQVRTEPALIAWARTRLAEIAAATPTTEGESA